MRNATAGEHTNKIIAHRNQGNSIVEQEHISRNRANKYIGWVKSWLKLNNFRYPDLNEKLTLQRSNPPDKQIYAHNLQSA